MRLIIFGSTGSVGRLLVEQALQDNHVVTAFLRDPGKLTIAHTNLKIIRGDVLDYQSVEKAMKNQEVVLCTLGAGSKGTVRAEGTRNIVRAMESNGVKRLICQSTLGAGNSKANLNFFWKHIMFGMLLKQAYMDHELQENYVIQSKLDWTIVRPAAFTDGSRTGNYRHGFGPHEKGLTLKISRADVADFILNQVAQNTYLRKTPGQSY
ncbi:MAG TPA: SDR family oxidoreductase [Chryseolinea sp.]|nr:SDR family oxidoreductase [Chryseolinea sp.]